MVLPRRSQHRRLLKHRCRGRFSGPLRAADPSRTSHCGQTTLKKPLWVTAGPGPGGIIRPGPTVHPELLLPGLPPRSHAVRLGSPCLLVKVNDETTPAAAPPMLRTCTGASRSLRRPAPAERGLRARRARAGTQLSRSRDRAFSEASSRARPLGPFLSSQEFPHGRPVPVLLFRGGRADLDQPGHPADTGQRPSARRCR